MAFSYRPQTLHDTIHTVLPGEVLPAIPGHSEFIAVRLFVFQLTASRKDWRPVLLHSSCRVSYFNSQPHEEGDIGYLTYWIFPPLFQLTASRRGWLRRVGQPLYRVHFNSQPHEEADADLLAGTISTNISTHSLTKRLTTWNCTPHEAYIISTHSLTKRLTLFSDEAIDMIDISTHSLTKRLTWASFLLSYFVIFQLTASRRGWRGDPT